MRFSPAILGITLLGSLTVSSVGLAQKNVDTIHAPLETELVQIPEVVPSSQDTQWPEGRWSKSASSARINPKDFISPGQLDNLGLCRAQVAKLQSKVKQLSKSVSSLSKMVAEVKPDSTYCVSHFSVTTTAAGGIASIVDCADNGYACDGTTGTCFTSCNNSTWCAGGAACVMVPRPGHCAFPTSGEECS